MNKVGKRREINKEDYPMVLDWSNYKNTKTKLLCKCQGCDYEVYKDISHLDRQKTCYCKKCGQTIKYKNTFLIKYGVDNPSKLIEIKKKIEETNINKYNNKCPLLNKRVKQKTIKTNIEKYGVEYPTQNKEIYNKIKQTNLKKYNTKHPIQNEKIKEKIKQTNIEKYGVIYPTQNEQIKEKVRQTNLNRYGTENYFSTKECWNKIKNTCVEKYGVPHYIQRNRTTEQINITSSKENFENYLKSFKNKPLVSELMNLLNYKDRSTIEILLSKWELWSYINRYSSQPEKEIAEYINYLGFKTIKKRFKWGENRYFYFKIKYWI